MHTYRVRRSGTMAMNWIRKRLTGNDPERPGIRDNGTDRNAVIKRIVSAASDDKKKEPDSPGAESGKFATATSEVHPPFTRQQTPAPRPGLTDDIPPEKIAARAFEIWVRKGRPFGTSDQDWLTAEAELKSELMYRPSDDDSDLPNKPR
jgi:hypothetical protein